MQEKPKQKNEYIKSILTLRKLKNKGIGPSQFNFEYTKTNKLRYKPLLGNFMKPKNSKALLMTKSDMIYYGLLSDNGDAQYQNPLYAGPKDLNFIRNLTQESCADDSLIVYPDGSFYLGEIHFGLPEGLGILTNLEKSFGYKGFFQKGLPNGLGIQKHLNNIFYEGQFVNGKKDGEGKLVYEEKNYYQGSFKENNISGKGRYYYHNYMWEGYWINGYLEGEGKQVIAKRSLQDLAESSEYTGNFKKGEKDGLGKFKWGKGYEYEGQFQKGQLNGEGTFRFKGKIYAGVWTNGTQVRITQLKRYNNSSISKKISNPQPKTSQN